MSDRRCPTCGIALIPETLDGVELDACPRCHGLWFDAAELAQTAGAALEAAAQADSDFREDPLLCPCDGNPMLSADLEHASVQVCPACQGHWVDGISAQVLLGLFDAAPSESSASEDVQCAGCGAEGTRARMLSTMDAYWCEDCVVRGDYPGGTGMTLAHRRALLGHEIQREVRRRHISQERAEFLGHFGDEVARGPGGVPANFGRPSLFDVLMHFLRPRGK